MPVIKCPECDNVVSDRLSKCPHCGRQLPISKRYPNFYEDKSNEHSHQNNEYDSQTVHENANILDKASSSNSTIGNSSQKNDISVKKAKPVKSTACPKCGSTNISYQREQTASFGAGTNKVVIQQAKKSKGCLWWMTIGWWWVPMYWVLIGWWWRPLFGGRTKSGLNFNANKSINRTMAVCQNCGHSWKV